MARLFVKTKVRGSKNAVRGMPKMTIRDKKALSARSVLKDGELRKAIRAELGCRENVLFKQWTDKQSESPTESRFPDWEIETAGGRLRNDKKYTGAELSYLNL
ncbi:hypothetical protein PHYBOEH_006815 [Phytophthora boehmeriae]|uniref:Uncharacterized protein n=1 Tax=Phytophthora boehmeriae TaxID=109152 RepID=A0A8T1WCH8_9STRA|nr:hypothetical protein PHYBOEH_006815 [Phytophthora boehmeriae]